MTFARAIYTEEIRNVVHVVDDDIDIAVVVEVGEGGAAARLGNGHRRSELLGDVTEAAVAQIPVDDLALFVTSFGFDALDFGIDVAVDEEQIEPAVRVEVHEAN